MTDVRNVVLVHGGFVDGSGWQGVYDLLKADGFNVSVVQNQTLSLESDVETTHNVLDQQDGPAILVGHSYGGVVITEAGLHDKRRRPRLHRRVRARRRRVGQHADRRPAARRAGAADPAARRTGSCSWTARSSRTPSRRISRPSWRRSWPTRRSRGASRRSTAPSASRPGAASRAGTWSPSDDRMIPPPAQRAMSERAGSTVVEAPGSHSIYVSQPQRDCRPDQAGRPLGARRERGGGRHLTLRTHPGPVRSSGPGDSAVRVQRARTATRSTTHQSTA